MPFLPRGLLWRSYSDCWFIGAQYTRSPLIFTSSTIGYRREGCEGARQRTRPSSGGMENREKCPEPMRAGLEASSAKTYPPFARRSIRNHTELTCYYASREGMCMSSRSTENRALAGPYLPSQDDLARFQSASVN